MSLPKTLGDVASWLKNDVEWNDMASEDQAVASIRVITAAQSTIDELRRVVDEVRRKWNSEETLAAIGLIDAAMAKGAK